MSEPSAPDFVKFFVAVLHPENEPPESIRAVLSTWGRQDWSGEPVLFDHTGYYEKEMGAQLARTLFSFDELQDPAALVQFKHWSHEQEKKVSSEGKRRLNIDPGYLDLQKVVLASFKVGWQKVYLSEGVYADMVLAWHNHAFQEFEWSFPDFKEGRYNQQMQVLRDLYKKQRRDWLVS